MSGGGVEFMRACSQEVRGVTSEHAIGSSIWTRHEARGFTYDRGSHIGKLERGLDEAGARGWSLISVKDDWKVVYTPQS